MAVAKDIAKRQVNLTSERKAHAGDWIETFLATLRKLPVVRIACQQAGISRALAYQWRQSNEEFRKQWDDAKEDGIDTVEAAMLVRAQQKDTVAGIFMLKNLRPSVYGDKPQQAVQVNVLTKVERVIVKSDD